MRVWWVGVIILLLAPGFGYSAFVRGQNAGIQLASPRYFAPPASTADHSKYEELKKDFKTPEEVTRACLKCHNKAGEQFKKTLHYTWTWKGKDGRLLGKAHVINNY
ncbi:MAG: hypothetical protein GXO20_05215 [Thermodesulfobacteria bacterium]|nr:hypothetical protein [Thermodesulfobacteriota bacterium]